jgi:hypothetical protein
VRFPSVETFVATKAPAALLIRLITGLIAVGICYLGDQGVLPHGTMVEGFVVTYTLVIIGNALTGDVGLVLRQSTAPFPAALVDRAWPWRMDNGARSKANAGLSSRSLGGQLSLPACSLGLEKPSTRSCPGTRTQTVRWRLGS